MRKMRCAEMKNDSAIIVQVVRKALWWDMRIKAWRRWVHSLWRTFLNEEHFKKEQQPRQGSWGQTVPGAFSFFSFIILFIYFWLCWVFAAAHELFSSCDVQASHCRGSSCGAWALGVPASVAVVCGLSSCSRAQAQWGFPGGKVVKNLPANAGDIRDAGLIPGLSRSSGGGHGNPLQYSCLENPKDGGAWQATIHGVAKSQTEVT